MRELYINSSFGWNPPEKKSELFHKLSRFILVRPNTGGPAIAFAMFRFEHEDGEDVIYCYDIQVSSAAQGAGLGTHILEHLIGIGFKWNMQQLMLTVFKDNKQAIKLYNSLGFIIHPSSPGNFPEGEDTDYEIMSKTLLEQTN
ncbi:acyl-CoA N-acyltransferase [Infundibulicybe gibba]|nr:acyl-CoA N-acyltransferase [Infundibulicybe gibba]